MNAHVTVYYDLAAKMEALAIECLQAGEESGDGILSDIGFSLIDDSREMVRDQLEFLKAESEAISHCAANPNGDPVEAVLEAAANAAVNLFIQDRNPGAGDDFIPSVEDAELGIEYKGRLIAEARTILADEGATHGN